jgi:hypothetical protein
MNILGSIDDIAAHDETGLARILNSIESEKKGRGVAIQKAIAMRMGDLIKTQEEFMFSELPREFIGLERIIKGTYQPPIERSKRLKDGLDSRPDKDTSKVEEELEEKREKWLGNKTKKRSSKEIEDKMKEIEETTEANKHPMARSEGSELFLA